MTKYNKRRRPPPGAKPDPPPAPPPKKGATVTHISGESLEELEAKRDKMIADIEDAKALIGKVKASRAELDGSYIAPSPRLTDDPRLQQWAGGYFFFAITGIILETVFLGLILWRIW